MYTPLVYIINLSATIKIYKLNSLVRQVCESTYTDHMHRIGKTLCMQIVAINIKLMHTLPVYKI